MKIALFAALLFVVGCTSTRPPAPEQLAQAPQLEPVARMIIDAAEAQGVELTPADVAKIQATAIALKSKPAPTRSSGPSMVGPFQPMQWAELTLCFDPKGNAAPAGFVAHVGSQRFGWKTDHALELFYQKPARWCARAKIPASYGCVGAMVYYREPVNGCTGRDLCEWDDRSPLSNKRSGETLTPLQIDCIQPSPTRVSKVSDAERIAPEPTVGAMLGAGVVALLQLAKLRRGKN